MSLDVLEVINKITNKSPNVSFSMKGLNQMLRDKTISYTNLYDEVLAMSAVLPDDINDIESWASPAQQALIEPGTNLYEFYIDNVYRPEVDLNKFITTSNGKIISNKALLIAFCESNYEELESITIKTKDDAVMTLSEVNNDISKIISSSTIVDAAMQAVDSTESDINARITKYNFLIEQSVVDVKSYASDTDSYVRNIILTEGLSKEQMHAEILKVVTSKSFSKNSNSESFLVTINGDYTGVSPAVAFLNSVNINFSDAWISASWEIVVNTAATIIGIFKSVTDGVVSFYDKHFVTAFVSDDIVIYDEPSQYMVMDVPYFQTSLDWIPGDSNPWEVMDSAKSFNNNLFGAQPAMHMRHFLLEHGLNIIDDDGATLSLVFSAEGSFTFDYGFAHIRLSYKKASQKLYFQMFLRPTHPAIFANMPKFKLVGGTYESIDFSLASKLSLYFDGTYSQYTIDNTSSDKKVFNGLCASRLRLEFFLFMLRISTVNSIDLSDTLASLTIDELTLNTLHTKFGLPFQLVDDNWDILQTYYGTDISKETFGLMTGIDRQKILDAIYFTKVPSSGIIDDEPNNNDFFKISTYRGNADVIDNLSNAYQATIIMSHVISHILINRANTIPFINFRPENMLYDNFFIERSYLTNESLPPRSILINDDRANGKRFQNLVIGLVVIASIVYFGPKLFRWRSNVRSKMWETNNALSYSEYEMGEKVYNHGFNSTESQLAIAKYRKLRKQSRKINLTAKLLGIKTPTALASFAAGSLSGEKGLSTIAHAIDETIVL